MTKYDEFASKSADVKTSNLLNQKYVFNCSCSLNVQFLIYKIEQIYFVFLYLCVNMEISMFLIPVSIYYLQLFYD